MADIFISHAVADKRLAKAFVDFMKEAIGVPSASIFCSSVAGQGIPLGEDFNNYIKDKIQKPKLVILLMTPTYLEREFCLMELGAAWAKSLRTLPVVVPPVEFAKVKDTLGLRQAWKIDDHESLNDLKVLVEALEITLEQRDLHVWDAKRTEWRRTLKVQLRDLKLASKVAREEHEALKAELAAKQTYAKDLERQLDRESEKVVQLERLKDATEVSALKKERGETSVEDAFAAWLDAVRAAQPAGIADHVFLHIVQEHYGCADDIEWDTEFERAVRVKLLSEDPPYGVQWGSGKLTALKVALKGLEEFMNGEEGEAWAEAQDDGSSTELNDAEFWETHLD